MTIYHGDGGDLVRRLRISRTYVRGPGDIGYDDRGEHDKYDGKPVGGVEDERREAASYIEAQRSEMLRAGIAAIKCTEFENARIKRLKSAAEKLART